MRRPVLHRFRCGWALWAVSLVIATAAETPAAFIPAAERGLPLVRTFLPRQYRGHEQIWSITETRDGLLLFGNLDHVVEFDGQNWRNIPVPGGSYIRVMVRDAEGTVFLGGVNEVGRLVPGPDGQLAYESLRALVPKELGDIGPFFSGHVRPDGVWLQANNALLHWNGRGFDTWKIESKYAVLSYEYDNRLVVCTDRGWLVPQPGGKWQQLGPDSLAPWLPRFFIRGPEGKWLVGSGAKGMMDFAPDGSYQPFPTEIDEWLKKCRPLNARQLADGRYIIHSLQRGVVLLSADLKFELLLDDQTGLATNTVIASYVDSRGMLWLGTDRGIAQVGESSPTRVFDQRHGMSGSGPDAIERQDGRIVVGGTSGAMELRPAAAVPGIPKFVQSESTQERLMSLLRLPDGMVGGGINGLMWISGGKSEKIDSPSGVREVVESRQQPGRFFGTHLNGFCSWRRIDGKWILEGDWPNLSGELRSTVLDADGSIWLSTPTEGVLRIVPAPDAPKALKIEKFGEAEGLPVNRQRVWLKEVGGAPLFQTRHGIFRYDAAARRFRPENRYGESFGSGGGYVRICTEDDRGGLWIVSESVDGVTTGIAYGRAGRVEKLPMTDLEGMGGVRFMNWERRDGQEILWIGTESQVRQVDLVRWRAAPPVSVGRTLLRGITGGDGQRLPADKPLTLQAGQSTLRFAYATPGLADEAGTLHETVLKGFADGQVELGAAGTRTFTNLPAGNYTFEARARTADGRWSEPAQFAFTVLAPWWQTPAGVALFTVLGALLLFVYVRWRIRGLRRERQRLEAVVAERTAELAHSNAELRRLHRLDQDEKLTARLSEEKARLELLRYQLNPHFLYNSLNSIRALIFSNAPAAGEMVTRLSEFCRWTLTRSADEMTTVAEEVEMLQAYLDIERTRWQDGLRASIEVTEDARPAPLPQFLLLPLLENAIKYGGKTSPDILEVRVRVSRVGETLICEVANTGHWVELNGETPRESTRIGLENLRQRLRRHYGPDCDFERSSTGGWVRVRLRMPLTSAVRSAEAV